MMKAPLEVHEFACFRVRLLGLRAFGELGTELLPVVFQVPVRDATEHRLFVAQLIHCPLGADIHHLWSITATMLEHVLQ